MEPLAPSEFANVVNTLRMLQGRPQAEPGVLDIIRSSLFIPQSSFISVAFLCIVGYCVARAAKAKGRSPVVWFWYAFWAAYIAIPHVLLARKNEEGIKYREGSMACPECGYSLKLDTEICPRCKADLRTRYIRPPHAPSEARPMMVIIMTMMIFGVLRYIESYFGIKNLTGAF